ncbi:translocase [Lutimaribacter marinistellae]|uniref:Protein translocase subunit SecA n=1 Tax=Lutimaribacter marinistellae TaxID=1820329 RepID=A0ABV7TL68_9RHOB
MPDLSGAFGFGRVPLGTGPYPELADPAGNSVDLWLERRLGRLTSRLPFTRNRLARRADRVLSHGAEIVDEPDDGLREMALKLRPALLRGVETDAVDRAFAITREVSARVLGKRHYKEQIMGAIGLYEGRMIEMATGEGKTLTATPAAVVAALSGKPVHVVTVNDYLASRDAEETAPVYQFLGLTVGVIDSDMDPQARQKAYACDITYVSNNNLTFDYLRDRIALARRRGRPRRKALELVSARQAAPLMLRGLAFAIVDEADSVLVDEARTPLILSSTADDPEAGQVYATALAVARKLHDRVHYKVDAMNRQVTLEEAGRQALSEICAELTGIWRIRRAREELAQQALSAIHLFELGRDYVILEGAVQIVDEFTGRVMPDRSWQGGLHQMIEAKERQEITGRKETLARITYQRFFRRYLRLSGMTGTGLELAEEFRDTFGLFTTRVPRHRASRVRHFRTRFCESAAAKWDMVADQVARLHEAGRPVLVGTRSVEASEACAAAIAARGLPHEVLNATQDREEAEIIARAGQMGAITVATNIAGRGTDIRLGEGVDALGGLHVILTEFHESPRIDRQLYGRTGRQGANGSTEAIVSFEDELFSRFAPRLLRLVRAFPSRVTETLLRRSAQSRAEAEHATTRREQTKLDRQLERALAFTGPTE